MIFTSCASTFLQSRRLSVCSPRIGSTSIKLANFHTSSCLYQMPVSDRSFEIVGNLSQGLKIGSYCQLIHSFSQADVNTFASLCGDNNPLHIDPSFAANTMFKGTIVHGIFVSSLFSTLFGRCITGSIYVSQNLQFKRPVHVGVQVKARMEVLAIEEKRKGRLLTCSTTCYLADSNEVAVQGEAKVLVPHS
jgi:3-hydroxybutyryl-CoA dehydratase